MRILIATPVEAALVERIAAADSGNVVDFEPRLLPPPRYPADHRGPPDWARSSADEARFAELLARADVIFGIPGDTGRGLATALARAPHVRWVQATAAGAGEQVRSAHLSPAILERVTVTTAAGVHGGMLAEFVFLGILALRKDLRRLETIRAARGWDHFASGELDGSTLAIVGFGHIGATTARIARAFGMQVLGVTRDGAPRDMADATYPVARMRDAFAQADAAVVTLPGTEQTRGLIDARALAALPAHAIFCNVGRGSVVDQDALVRALEAGRLAGAVLDVTDPEPLPPGNPLWSMSNVVLAPHTMALSVRENERIVELFCDNLRRFAAGRPLRNRVDPVEFY